MLPEPNAYSSTSQTKQRKTSIPPPKLPECLPWDGNAWGPSQWCCSFGSSCSHCVMEVPRKGSHPLLGASPVKGKEWRTLKKKHNTLTQLDLYRYHCHHDFMVNSSVFGEFSQYIQTKPMFFELDSGRIGLLFSMCTGLQIVVCFLIVNQRWKPHQQHNITGNPESSMVFMISCLKYCSQASLLNT